MNHLLALAALVLGSWAQAMTCSELLSSIDAAFGAATEVVMTTDITQGEREFAYSRLRLFRAEDGTWASEVLEQRGQQRPPERENGSAEPQFDFSCAGNMLEASGRGWTLVLPEQESDLPVGRWTLFFTRSAGQLIPEAVSGDFTARILFLPFRGSFRLRFTDWRFPVP